MGVASPVAPQRRAAVNIGHSGTPPLCLPCYRIVSPRRSCGSQAETKRRIAGLSDVSGSHDPILDHSLIQEEQVKEGIRRAP